MRFRLETGRRLRAIATEPPSALEQRVARLAQRSRHRLLVPFRGKERYRRHARFEERFVELGHLEEIDVLATPLLVRDGQIEARIRCNDLGQKGDGLRARSVRPSALRNCSLNVARLTSRRRGWRSS